MERLSPLDVSFLHLEDDVSHMHLGSVGVFEGPPPPQADVLAAIASKLHRAPRYRRRVRFVPLEAGRPVWCDDPHFDLGYHVRRTALPAPGGDEQLRILVGRVMSQQLDRSRPLWEMWVVEGLGDGRWAVISKLHHAMVDGISGSSLITTLFDEERDAAHPDPLPWSPAPTPSDARLVTAALAERARWPLREAQRLADAVRDPGGALTHAEQTLRGLAAYAGLVRAPQPSTLNGPIGPHRRWSWARAQLTDVKEIRETLGGTVNDVVLAAIAGAFRTLLEERGEPADHVLRTLVPVSVRTRGQGGVYDNQVSAIFAELPVNVEDPEGRLLSIRHQMAHLKGTHEAVAGEALTALGGFAPELLLTLGARVATRLPQRSVNTVTTNVPGPQRTLYFAGRRMLETFPYVPLGGHVRIGVAIYSYDGGLGFGVTADADRVPDADVLSRAIETSMDELLGVARARAERRRERHGPGAAVRSRPR